MFTGIVEELGEVVAVERRGNLVRLRLRAERVLDDARVGDSLCHNGVCLTITELTPPHYACDVMAETMQRSTLGRLHAGDRVNLERALAVGGRFGGHFVQGHVDGVGQIRDISRVGEWVTYEVGAPDAVLGYVVAKGSITIDGISLTVVDRRPSSFTVSLIPHTLAETTLQDRHPGDWVNLEADILAKYVQAALQREPGAGGTMTFAWLADHGFGTE